MTRSLSQDRRGLEMAAGMIVILTISVIVFGMASVMAYRIVCTAEDQYDTLTAQSEQAFERRIASGAAVGVADAVKDIELPSRVCGNSALPSAAFALAMRAPPDTTAAERFGVECMYLGYEQAGGQLSNLPGSACVAANGIDGTTLNAFDGLSPGKIGIQYVVVNPDPAMESGRHMYTLTVKKPDNTNLGVVNIYVNIA